MEREDFQVSLEVLDQRVTQEIPVPLVTHTFLMEVMQEVLEVTLDIQDSLDPRETQGSLGGRGLLANQD